MCGEEIWYITLAFSAYSLTMIRRITVLYLVSLASFSLAAPVAWYDILFL